jgi:predicted amidophosphoribosyltransferase
MPSIIDPTDPAYEYRISDDIPNVDNIKLSENRIIEALLEGPPLYDALDELPPSSYWPVRRAEAYSVGVCSDCWKPHDIDATGTPICPECRQIRIDMHVLYNAARHADYVKRGVCTMCGGNRDSNYKLCANCREDNRRRYRRSRV